jgi:hypothetical protein
MQQQMQPQQGPQQQPQPVPWEQENPFARLHQPAALGVQQSPFYAQVPAPSSAPAVAQSSSGVPMYGQLPFPATATAPVATAPPAVSAFPGPQPFPMYAPTD